MSKKIKLLIVSNSPWDDNNSFGNSFSNILGENENYEIANIYCKPGNPNTSVCSRFFQITETSILKNIFTGQPSGREVFNDSIEEIDPINAIRTKASIWRWQIFMWARDIIWGTKKWKSKELNKYIIEFRPDLIFLPIYYSSYMNDIGQYVGKLAAKPIVGYISDDCYTLRRYSLSPLFWLDFLIKRRFVKQTIDICKLLYTITDKQAREYNKIFGNKCKILTKGGNFTELNHQVDKVSNPIRLVYTGNLGGGRWKTLAIIGKALLTSSQNATLEIYSASILSNRQMSKLCASSKVKFKGSVPVTRVKSLLRAADILVHVEPFGLKERYSARLSLSTKIIDYLESGKCILAVGWRETAAIEYLKEHDSAYIITDVNIIANEINNLLNKEALILEYGKKGFQLGFNNHRNDKIRQALYSKFIEIAFP